MSWGHGRGLLIREARLRAGLTQAELAGRASTSQPAIARYERGDVSPRVDTLDRIVCACGLELLSGLIQYDGQEEDLVRDALNLQLGSNLVKVASLADVIRSKEAAGRAKDLAVLPTLRAMLERQQRG